MLDRKALVLFKEEIQKLHLSIPFLCNRYYIVHNFHYFLRKLQYWEYCGSIHKISTRYGIITNRALKKAVHLTNILSFHPGKYNKKKIFGRITAPYRIIRAISKTKLKTVYSAQLKDLLSTHIATHKEQHLR